MGGHGDGVSCLVSYTPLAAFLAPVPPRVRASAKSVTCHPPCTPLRSILNRGGRARSRTKHLSKLQSVRVLTQRVLVPPLLNPPRNVVHALHQWHVRTKPLAVL